MAAKNRGSSGVLHLRNLAIIENNPSREDPSRACAGTKLAITCQRPTEFGKCVI
jgi:hypothetical protein